MNARHTLAAARRRADKFPAWRYEGEPGILVDWTDRPRPPWPPNGEAMTSAELLKAQKAGAEILHNGAPVAHLPRSPRDPRPWCLVSGGQVFHYAASECVEYFPPVKDSPPRASE